VSTRVCRFDELGACAATRVEIDGEPVAVVRIGEEVFAIGDTCSHGQFSLSEGQVWCDERELECWKHGSAFDLRSGEPTTLPATQPVAVWSAKVVDGWIELEPPQ
jgi:3-phenylpropionate/trans-cinnamate dioxygenase ferredoxin component